jgi:glycerol 3-phosphatase-2
VLTATEEPLSKVYDVAMLDLDGVVYVGPDAVPGVPGHLAAARRAGLRLAYITNNASRPPDSVARHLRDLGIQAADDDVVTSAQAAARLLRDQLAEGEPVFVVGGQGLLVALEEQGLRPVSSRDADPVAVVSGFSADLRWSTVIEGAILVRDGLPWVASNTDLTVPTPHGPGPGNGALVEVVARFAGRAAQVAGKPEPPLFQETLRRVGGRRPLVVGDRLDTDIEGARRVGYDSLLVMTGVTSLDQLVTAGPEQRPSYVAADLGCLARPQTALRLSDGVAASEGWRASVQDGTLAVEADGSATAEPQTVDGWWRVAAAAAWAHLDAHGSAVDVDGLRPPGSVGPSHADG